MKDPKCVVCDCELNDGNRAEWSDHCEDCELAVFEFYGAVCPVTASEEIENDWDVTPYGEQR